MYYDLVNAHRESMASISSFAISGIADLAAPILMAQTTTDTNSFVQTTSSLEHLILDANVPGADTVIFSSIEPTGFSHSEGRYLLLTNKHKIGPAEHMIDELIEYIRKNPEIHTKTTINSMDIKHANNINVSNSFNKVDKSLFPGIEGPPMKRLCCTPPKCMEQASRPNPGELLP
jgi:hypothetical protein